MWRQLISGLICGMICGFFPAPQSTACGLPAEPAEPLLAEVALADGLRRVLVFSGTRALQSAGRWGPELDFAHTAALAPVLDPSALSIIDFASGELLWQWVAPLAGEQTATPSADAAQAAPIDSAQETVMLGQAAPLINARGALQRLYFGDSHGAVWRVELSSQAALHTLSADWRVSRLARAGSAPPQPGGAWPPAFAAAPDLLYTRDASGRALEGVVIAGTAMAATDAGLAAQGWLFYVRDYAPTARQESPGRDDIVLASLPDALSCTAGAAGCETGPGWRRALGAGDVPVASPVVEGGRIFLGAFSLGAFSPGAWSSAGEEACAEQPGLPAGDPLVYVLQLSDGAPVIGGRAAVPLAASAPLRPVLHPSGMTLRPLPLLPASGDAGTDYLEPDAGTTDPVAIEQLLPPEALPHFMNAAPVSTLIYRREPLADQ